MAITQIDVIIRVFSVIVFFSQILQSVFGILYREIFLSHDAINNRTFRMILHSHVSKDVDFFNVIMLNVIIDHNVQFIDVKK